jgi:AcrR family transcriptional regulator
MAARSPRVREPLTRDRILRAALELADEGGETSLTMQAIGRKLGVEAMSLYRHVRNKDDLLDGLVDLVFEEIQVPEAGAWRPAIRARTLSAREALRRHPWAIRLLESRTSPGPANLRSHDRTLALLVDAGFTATTATHGYNLLDSYLLGFALQEANLPFASAEEMAEIGPQLLAQVPADEYPTFVRVSGELLAAGYDYAAEFEFGLDLILDGIERMRAAQPR